MTDPMTRALAREARCSLEDVSGDLARWGAARARSKSATEFLQSARRT
ncbi:MAG TPA: hypothetical protein VGH86_14820 [Phenylobacterium sp.]|jgi:hypothetical protein